MKKIITSIPFVGSVARYIYNKWIYPTQAFESSESYWKKRYESGKNSGAGSYRLLAEFKAEVLNGFVRDHDVSSVIEYGCGDGNQLKLAHYPSYVGFDVSPKAISLCESSFSSDGSKAFKLMEAYNGERADLTLSIDVIYHLVEDEVFVGYMNRLFESSNKFVIIYSSDIGDNSANTEPHVRHRQFTEWVKRYQRDWKVIKVIPNRYPFRGDYTKGSLADFFLYSRVD